MCEGVVDLLHYLDDFLFWCQPGSSNLEAILDMALSLCSHLGLPAAPMKVEGPTTSLTFLGIIINSERQELRLPHPKLVKFRHQLAWFSKRWNTTKLNPVTCWVVEPCGLCNTARAAVYATSH